MTELRKPGIFLYLHNKSLCKDYLFSIYYKFDWHFKNAATGIEAILVPVAVPYNIVSKEKNRLKMIISDSSNHSMSTKFDSSNHSMSTKFVLSLIRNLITFEDSVYKKYLKNNYRIEVSKV